MAKKDRTAIMKKAWATRRANATKKRGVKPGTKRGPYRKARSRKRTIILSDNEMLAAKAYAPNPVLTLCGQLEDSILLLEQRISNAIAKINSLMG